MSQGNEQQAELYLAIANGDTVRCRGCGGTVDFNQSCGLMRDARGHLEITKCHTCLTNPARLEAAELLDVAGRLVDVFGHAGARAEITRALSLPAPGSAWVYTDSRSSTGVERLEFTFVRFFGELLQFSGPFGNWVCTRDEWAHHLAASRVRPCLVPAAARS